MAVAKYYGRFFQSVFNKEIDIDSDSFKLMLCTSSYTPDQDAHRYKSSVTNEVTGPGYTAGGATVSPLSVAYDTATNIVSFDGADATWPASTITARWAVLYDATPATDATRPLVGYVDFGADVGSVAAAFTVAWSVDGIARVTVA